jgi:hypothetical protein
MICLVYLEQASSFSSVQCMSMTSLHLQGAATTCMHGLVFLRQAGGVGARGVMTNDSQALFMHAMRALREIILVSF